MKAIDHPTAPGGEFRDADPGVGQAGTVVPAAWLNDVQRELVSVISASGQTPTAGIAQFYRALIDLTYRVGDYLTTESNVTPAQRWPWSTWVEVKGRVLVGLDTGQTEFAALGQQGGAKTHTLTVPEIPPHKHPTGGQTGLVGTGDDLTLEGQGTPQETGEAGGGQPHNNLQPYRVVRMWKRTA